MFESRARVAYARIGACSPFSISLPSFHRARPGIAGCQNSVFGAFILSPLAITDNVKRGYGKCERKRDTEREKKRKRGDRHMNKATTGASQGVKRSNFRCEVDPSAPKREPGITFEAVIWYQKPGLFKELCSIIDPQLKRKTGHCTSKRREGKVASCGKVSNIETRTKTPKLFYIRACIMTSIKREKRKSFHTELFPRTSRAIHGKRTKGWYEITANDDGSPVLRNIFSIIGKKL